MKRLGELELWLIGTLIAASLVEGIFVAEILTSFFQAARQWQSGTLVADVFIRLFLLVAVLVGINFALGLFLSRKITRPLEDLENGLDEIYRGNVGVELPTRRGDFFQDLISYVNSRFTGHKGGSN